MNKFTKISAVTLFALFLSACDKPANGAEDFRKLLEWKQTQEQSFSIVQNELEQQLATQDISKIEQSLEMFKGKITEILSGLDKLEIKAPEVNAFKAKAKENLELLNGLVVDSVKGMTSQAPELQNAIQEKLQLLQKSTAELNQIQMDLEQKYLNK